MEEEKFKEIIQFAIAKEIGATDFYTQASEKAKYSDTKELLLKISTWKKLTRQRLKKYLI
jgi:rubrerythrin